MSTKGTAGKAAWTARSGTFPDELRDEITQTAEARMQAWRRKGRIPLRVRIMARLSGRPVPRLDPGTAS